MLLNKTRKIAKTGTGNGQGLKDISKPCKRLAKKVTKKVEFSESLN